MVQNGKKTIWGLGLRGFLLLVLSASGVGCAYDTSRGPSADGHSIQVLTLTPPQQHGEAFSSVGFANFTANTKEVANSVAALVAAEAAATGVVEIIQSNPDALLSASLSISRVGNNTYTRRYKNRDNETITTYFREQVCSLTGTFSLMSRDGRVIAGGPVQANYEKTDSSQDGYPQGRPEQTIINGLKQDVAIQIARAALPHYTESYVRVLGGYSSNAELKDGVQQAKIGLYDVARDRFNQAASSESYSAGIRAMAYHNLALLAERSSQYEQALKYLNIARQFDPNKKEYSLAQSRVNQAIINRENLNKWRNSP
ncbi:MAG: tetratricopeptide repeat protein [Planctomycetota bacterium]